MTSEMLVSGVGSTPFGTSSYRPASFKEDERLFSVRIPSRTSAAVTSRRRQMNGVVGQLDGEGAASTNSQSRRSSHTDKTDRCNETREVLVLLALKLILDNISVSVMFVFLFS